VEIALAIFKVILGDETIKHVLFVFDVAFKIENAYGI